MQRTLALLWVIALAGCSGAGTVPASMHGPQPLAAGARALHDSTSAMPGEASNALPGEASNALPGEASNALPGEASNALPGEASNALPGEASNALPGEASNALPGAALPCPGPPAAGSASCTIAVNTNVPPVANPALPAAAIPGFHPADLQSAYALPASNAGGIVAVVDAYDDPAAESDLAVYRAAFGLPACTSANGCFRKIDQRGRTGTYPAASTAWSQETALDLDMVSAACPRCSIVLVEADSASLDDLGASVDTAVGQGAIAVSNSYYATEWSGQGTEDAHYRHQGVAITASSGDRGYPSYPASSQYVTAVGGTSLARAGGGWSETGWKYTGHGCSRFTAKPWFQTKLGCKTRDAVDVAAVADPQTGVATFSTAGGGWYVAGGTSAGAPLIAAAYALSGHPQSPGFSYLHWRTGFRQIDGAGYEPLTGIGSPLGISGL
ncbi:MAG TPA: hypothetical protein VK669_03810 [Candidatus Limnocylindrales bacterium]|nr:hypothetical protein [Candidatus Limnocylindrales bacterium]